MEENEFIPDSKFVLITHDELDQLVYILAILLTIAPKIEYQLQINTLEQNWVKFVPHLRQLQTSDGSTAQSQTRKRAAQNSPFSLLDVRLLYLCSK